MADYDEIQLRHYNSVAVAAGASPESTMPDRRVRLAECDGIVKVLRNWVQAQGPTLNAPSCLDVGCGNGTTLGLVQKEFPAFEFVGVEPNDQLRAIAAERLGGDVFSGDLRDLSSLPERTFDVVICQRVLINIMAEQDQESALTNLLKLVRPGGLLIAIESFRSGLELTNQARSELGLEPVAQPYHNLFIADQLFDRSELTRVDLGVDEYFLSTYYYLSYVLFPLLAKAGGVEFQRNSIFVELMNNALPNVGSFGANRFMTFTRNQN